MDQAGSTLKAVPTKPQDPQANDAHREETGSTSPSNDCPICGGVGWMWVETEEFRGVKRCECLKLRILQEKLAGIPERFRGCTFQTYEPRSPKQMRARAMMLDNPERSYFLYGPYGSGKTHLLYAQYRSVLLGGTPCHVRTMVELLSEIQKAETDSQFVSPVLDAVRGRGRYHLFWDDADKFKMTEFKSQGLFDLIDTIYQRNLNLTVTSNFTLRELAEAGKLDPAFIRRLDDMCRVLEV